KRTSGRSSNTKGSDNIISSGSVIAVADGQCMIIVEQGKVVELCAEPGEFVFDASTEPTIFSGKLSESIPAVFQNIGKRFTFGGEPPKDQRVYYFNTKEVIGNKYGTPSPVPFRVVDPKSGLDIDVDMRCSGEYSYRVSNPILFYANVCGNVESDYTRDQIDSQLKAELISALRPALGRVSELGIRPSQITTHEEDILEALKQVLSAKWLELRGIELVVVTMPIANISEEDRQRINKWQENAVLTNTNMAAATLVGAQADAMKAAASNEGGAMMGFMGLNMAQQTGGMNAQSLFQMGQQQQQAEQAQQAAPAGWACSCGHTGNTGKFCAECAKPKPSDDDSWTCSCGHTGNKGKFCAECAKPKPAGDSWTCSCGTVNKGKFCAECANPRPADNQARGLKCGKCGWEPDDPAKTPKFCPECAAPF
ncbi:MAG: SPFH domain-containing protein, partial [Oscillospiraceae bacterium]|nr:SPFH domain-containing protein [Oscillospiraceae bacterium]